MTLIRRERVLPDIESAWLRGDSSSTQPAPYHAFHDVYGRNEVTSHVLNVLQGLIEQAHGCFDIVPFSGGSLLHT